MVRRPAGLQFSSIGAGGTCGENFWAFSGGFLSPRSALRFEAFGPALFPGSAADRPELEFLDFAERRLVNALLDWVVVLLPLDPGRPFTRSDFRERIHPLSGAAASFGILPAAP
ncbi:MAG: hypothetical protein JOZ60_05855 [Verrucomicrobia bacterium]|nr:hypothetical protein [Verrucomicrobiota bacterium]